MNSSESEKNQQSSIEQGRILRVKHGYNPNSSSMGSMIFILPASLMAVTAGFGVISAVIMAKVLKNPAENPDKQGDTSAERGQQE